MPLESIVANRLLRILGKYMKAGRIMEKATACLLTHLPVLLYE